jgi:hypothetical protein
MIEKPIKPMTKLLSEELFEAKWTNDCQDKQDYDFDVLKVCTRYYGRDYSSIPSIMLGDEVIKEPNEYLFGVSESDCKAKAEQWIDKELEKILDILKKNGYIVKQD